VTGGGKSVVAGGEAVPEQEGCRGGKGDNGCSQNEGSHGFCVGPNVTLSGLCVLMITKHIKAIWYVFQVGYKVDGSRGLTHRIRDSKLILCSATRFRDAYQ